MWDVLFFALFLTLLCLPFVPSLRELELKNDASPLKIVQSYDGDVRIFAENFRKLVNQELLANSSGLASAASEKFRVVDGGFLSSPEEQKTRQVSDVVVSLTPLDLPDGFVFEREVYGKQNVISGYNDRFRAILADQDLVLKGKTIVTRWAHARRVWLGSDVTVIGRLSADEIIVMKPSCMFTRVNAPIIRFGYEKHENMPGDGVALSDMSSARIFSDVENAHMDERGCWLVKGDFAIPPNGSIKSNMIVHGDLRIGEGTVLTGSIKTHGNLLLDSRVKIMGALVSENNVTIGEQCLIKGPIVSEKTVHIEPGAVIGTINFPTTVTAESIRAKSGVFAHGTLWARSTVKVANAH